MYDLLLFSVPLFPFNHFALLGLLHCIHEPPHSEAQFAKSYQRRTGAKTYRK